MSNARTSFEIGEKNAKLSIGPAAPNAGPILLMADATEEKVVSIV